MRIDDLQNDLEIASQLFGDLPRPQAAGSSPPTTDPISLHALKRMPFFIQHALDVQDGFDIALNVQSLITSTLLGF